MPKQPNVIFVFGDQWRAQATGFGGDPNVSTPNLDALAEQSVNFTHAVSGCPVCSPYRASLITGQRPLTHGVFMNDVPLRPRGKSIAQAFAAEGYDTAYIGKWHLDGPERSAYIPPSRRLGFEYWKVLECTHNYNRSAYYAGDSDQIQYWQGYDAEAQTEDALAYIRENGRERPFFLMLSWGPPHGPYQTAPDHFQELYTPESLTLRPNVPDNMAGEAREWLAGYYAHCSALDACVGRLLATLKDSEMLAQTVFVFTSDHGDMLGSQGEAKKQRPWDESIRVPFLLHYPEMPDWLPRRTDCLITPEDIMPTLLGLCGLEIPTSAEGLDYSGHLAGGPDPSDGAALLMCVTPFGQWAAGNGGRAYRGVRTRTHTYVRDQEGPWLLYNNSEDPYQQHNLVNSDETSRLLNEMEDCLQRSLDAASDAFLPGQHYIDAWGYGTDDTGTVTFRE